MKYYANSVQFDTDSAENQEILSKLVNREVYCCMTGEIEYLLSRVDYHDPNHPFEPDDIYYGYGKECSFCGAMDEFEEFKVSDFPVDDIVSDELDYYCPCCGLGFETLSEARECCKDETMYRCTACGEIYDDFTYDNLNHTAPEIFEWWAVSNWFGDKLASKNQVVIVCWGKSYWGRCTTGQSIYLDGCIAEIAIDMEILKGQPYAW